MKLSTKITFIMMMIFSIQLFANADIVPSEDAVVTQILTGLVGIVIYYVSKLGNAGFQGFDGRYWWNENKISLLANVGAIIVVTLLSVFNLNLLESILSFLGTEINGQVGSIAFSTVLAGVVHNLVKQLRGKAYVPTDGNGNKE